MNYTFLDPWHGFLPREGGHVLSVMGSGGKTTLLLALAKLYEQWNIPVILTTTTQSEILAGMPVIDVQELKETATGTHDQDQLPRTFFLKNGSKSEDKWAGLTPEMVDELGVTFPDRVVLVEVDGSAKMPVKIHREGEPVWPSRTSLAFILMGTAAVGEPVANVVHRYGRQPSRVLDSIKAWENLEWDHLQGLLLGDGGYLQQVPEGVPAMLVLTGLDQQDDSIGLFGFVGQAMEDQRLPLVAFCDFGSKPESVRVACRTNDHDD